MKWEQALRVILESGELEQLGQSYLDYLYFETCAVIGFFAVVFAVVVGTILYVERRHN